MFTGNVNLNCNTGSGFLRFLVLFQKLYAGNVAGKENVCTLIRKYLSGIAIGVDR